MQCCLTLVCAVVEASAWLFTHQTDKAGFGNGRTLCIFGHNQQIFLTEPVLRKSSCAGMTHQFWNSNNVTDMDMQFTVTPAGNFEAFIRTMCGLAADAGSVADINPLQMMVLFVGGGMEIAAMPRPVWLFIERIVVPLSQLLQVYQPTYPEYTT